MIALLALLTACSGDEADRGEALSAAHGLVFDQYAAFGERADVLASAAVSFCNNPDDSGLSATRDAWWEARGAFKQADFVGFGPVVEEPDRLGPPIDFWPARTGAIDTLLAGEADLSANSFANLGSATRGLPAIEYVLYDDALLEQLTSEPRRCAFLVGASEDLASNAHALHHAWGAWETRLVDPQQASDTADELLYTTRQSILDEWVNRVVFAADDIRHEKLGAALGDATGTDTRPDVLESRYSGRSLMDARDTLAGAHAVLLTLLPLADDPELTAHVQLAYDTASARLAEVPEPLETTIIAQPELVVRAQDALRSYQIAVQVDAAAALAVSIAFNDNDGD